MITDAIINRTIHCLCVYHLIVDGESRFVADISGVNEEGRLLIVNVLLEIGYPTPHSTRHFGVGDLHERMFSGFCPLAFS